MEKLLEYVREEFIKILQGPGVSWNKQGILAAFDKAWVFGLSRYAREKGIVID